ncbi:MAG: sulfite exporter TauE/SafE family protein [Ruminococcaceae bacterium]|nr:sulfite exporter TauE/SafE family protein [Oscillospiraceae bacterium]
MKLLLPFLCGAATGMLSAWGIGGGTLLLLCMTLFFGVDQSTAQGVNLLYFLPAALSSLRFHRENGYLDSEVLKRAAPPGVVCALLGAYVSLSVDTTLLRKPFGLFLLFAAVSTLRQQKYSKRI